jgi:glycosyltransferase involved in cell wall biosynthesis
MAKSDVQVFFVLPTFPDRVVDRHLEVVGARECLIEAGWNPDLLDTRLSDASAWMGSLRPELKPEQWSFSQNLIRIRSSAQMFPYESPPDGKVPSRLSDALEEGSFSSPSPPVRVRPISQEIQLDKKTIPAAVYPTHEIYGKNFWSEIERYCLTVTHLSEAHEVDLVHAHDWMTFPAAFEFQRVTGVPVCLHVHATEYDRSGENLNHEVFRIEREGFKKATHIFAVSRYTAGILERLYGVNPKKISIVYNAPEERSLVEASSVAIQSLNSQRVFVPSRVEDRKPQVVFLGRLTFQKGPDHFLKAAALVCEANLEAQFVFCGAGDLLDQLRTQAHGLGIEARVHFAGFMSPVDVDEVLLHSKVLVMPSVSEPFGLVALEAIRCGIPVILSKQSGVREVLSRALQVDFWDHEKLADQILGALRLQSLSQQLVEEGLQQIKELSWEKSAQQVIQVYRQLLETTYAEVIGGGHGH